MLPKVQGRPDVERLDHYLSAFQAAHGIAARSTPVIVLITEAAEAMFHTGDYKGAPRIVAHTWGAEDLADSIGASSARFIARLPSRCAHAVLARCLLDFRDPRAGIA